MTEEPQTFTARVPLRGDRLTDEALAKLIGQEPVLTVGWDNSKGHVKVVKAEQPDDDLHLTFELRHAVQADLVEQHGSDLYGIGFTIADASLTEDAEHRTFKDIRLMEVRPDTPPGAKGFVDG